MGLKTLLARRPILIALAGPNGAGKSTFFDAILADTGLYFVNADVIALTLGMDPYAAAHAADQLRRQLVQRRESFVFETVFSDPKDEKLNFLKDCENAGYTVLLLFVGLSNPVISDQRVAMRAAAGGHDVPRQKLIDRYPRTMENLKKALRDLSNVRVYDNSDLETGYRLVAEKDAGQKVTLYRPIPGWLRPLLP